MANTLQIKRNSTGTPSSLAAGELAVNTANGNLWCGNTAGDGVIHLNPSVSTSYLPLAGGTLTGALLGTSFRMSDYGEIRADDAELYFENAANNRYWRWKLAEEGSTDTFNYILDHYNGTSTSDVLKFTPSNNAIFSGTITATGGTLSGALTATGATISSSGNGELTVSRTSGAAVLTQAQSAAGRIGTTTNHDMQFMANNTVYARLKNDGRFGIGVTPSSLLHLYSSAPVLTIQDGGTWGTNATGYIELKDSGSTVSMIGVTGTAGHLDILHKKAGSIRMFTDDTERLTINSSGQLGIGRTPSACLDILDPYDGNITWSTFLRVGRRGGDSTNELELKSLHDGSDEVDGFAVFLHGGECLAVDHNKRLFLNALPPGTYAEATYADDFVLGDTGNHAGMTIRSGTSHAGSIYFADGVTGDQKYRGYIEYNHNGDVMSFGAGAANRLKLSSSEVTINEGSNNVDFRVEGDGDQNLIRTDASNDRVGIKTASPSYTFHCVGTGYFSQAVTMSAALEVSGNGSFGGANATSAKLFVRGGYADFWHSTNNLLRVSHDGSRAKLQGFTGGAYDAISLNPDGGAVGVGCDPTKMLEVSSGSHTEFVLNTTSNTSNCGIDFNLSGSRKGIIRYDHNATDSSGEFEFYTGGNTSTARMIINGTGHVSINSTALSSYGHFGVAQPAGTNTDGIAVVNGTNSFRLYVDDAGMRRLNAGDTSVVEFNASSFNVFQPLTVGSNGSGHDVRFWADNGKFWEWDESMELTRANDGVKSVWGSGDDLEIYHDGSNSYQQQGSNAGNLNFTYKGGQKFSAIFKKDGTGNNGAVELFWDGSKRIETTSAGATITGSLGVGTVSPTSLLHVTGSLGNSAFVGYIYNDGTQTEDNGLNVQIASSGSSAMGLRVNTGGDSNAFIVAGDGDTGLGFTPSNFAQKLNVNGGVYINGNTGIGVSTPISPLTVDGDGGIYVRHTDHAGIAFDDTNIADGSSPITYISGDGGSLVLGRANRNSSTGRRTASSASITIVGNGTSIESHTHFRPYNNNTYTCGTAANRWNNVYSVGGNFSGLTQVQSLNITTMGSFITFYGDGSGNHSISSRNASGGADDDLRINTYGSLIVNLDSNGNNDSNADFIIARHGQASSAISSSDNFLNLNGETGQLRLHKYGGTGMTGTATKFLAVDSYGHVIQKNGLTKVTFHLKWGSESGNGTNGSWRDNGTDGKIELMHGSKSASNYWADGDDTDQLVKIRFTHDLNTKYLNTSILDVAGKIQGANEYLDMGHNQDAIVKYISANVSEVIIDLSANNDPGIATNDEFEITFIG